MRRMPLHRGFCPVRRSDFHRSAGAKRRAVGHRVLRQGRPDGRRGGQRQEGRLDRHHQRRDRRQGPLQLPGRQARARPVRAQHPRHRLRPRKSQKRRRHGRKDRKRRDQACADQEPRQADVERRMVHELPRHRPGEEGAAQLRELPQPRPHRALAVRRRAVRRHLQPDGGLLPGQHAGASAASGRQRAALARPGPAACEWSRSIWHR